MITKDEMRQLLSESAVTAKAEMRDLVTLAVRESFERVGLDPKNVDSANQTRADLHFLHRQRVWWEGATERAATWLIVATVTAGAAWAALSTKAKAAANFITGGN